jgi:hypothetical protein
LNRRTNTPGGSGGASPTVVTVQHDDDDLMVETDETAAPEASVNGSSAANGEEADIPALPADTIRPARDSGTFSRPVSAPVSPPADDQWKAAQDGAPSSAAEPAAAEPVLAEPEPDPAEPLTVGTSLYEPGTSAEGDFPSAQPSGPEPATVSAASFAWHAPAPTSAPSPAPNFLSSNTNAKTSAPPRTPAVSVGPGRAQAGRGAASAARPAPGPRPKGSAKRSARQAHLTIARVEPWSVMKFSFVVSLVAFVILFVAVAVIYSTLSALGVFTSLQHVVQSVTSSQDSSGVNAAKWFTASRILSYTALLGALNIVLITAMSTIGAVVYNLTSRLIGGVEVTLRETE